MLLGTFVFIAMALGMGLMDHSPSGSFDFWSARILSAWGALCFVWFFFVLKARWETMIRQSGAQRKARYES